MNVFGWHIGAGLSRGRHPFALRRWVSAVLCVLVLLAGLHVTDAHTDQAQMVAAQDASDDGSADPSGSGHDHKAHLACVGGALCSMVAIAPEGAITWDLEGHPLPPAGEVTTLVARSLSPLLRPPNLSSRT